VAAYLRHLKVMDYSGQTIVLLLSGLRCALRILAPEVDGRWVTRPDGQSVLSFPQAEAGAARRRTVSMGNRAGA